MRDQTDGAPRMRDEAERQVQARERSVSSSSETKKGATSSQRTKDSPSFLEGDSAVPLLRRACLAVRMTREESGSRRGAPVTASRSWRVVVVVGGEEEEVEEERDALSIRPRRTNNHLVYMARHVA